MENIALTNKLSQEIFNGTQIYANLLSRPQKFNFREIIRGILISGSTYLNGIGKANGSNINERKTVERLSNTLSKIPTEIFESLHVQTKLNQYKNEAVLILSDGGDIQKPHAKKMKKVCGTVDGSHGHKAGKGYPLHALMALGVESGNLNPLVLRTYSTLEENFKSEWTEHQKSFELLHPFIRNSAYDWIIIEDRGCDDEKRFLYFLNELEASFVTRIHAGNKSRNYMVEQENREFEIMNVKEIGEKLKAESGSEKIWWNRKVEKELTSKIAFQKVYLPEHLNIPLYAIFCYSEGYDEPLVILTDLGTNNFERAWKHFFITKNAGKLKFFFVQSNNNLDWKTS